MRVAETIEKKLKEAFAPSRLEVEDQSHLHAGHAGAREGGQSHFAVEIVAEAFAGHSRLERQRMINAVLAEELAGPIHALSLNVRTPSEA
ncbi:MAG: BolA family protein [Alphaproteobacteria bacterium]